MKREAVVTMNRLTKRILFLTLILLILIIGVRLSSKLVSIGESAVEVGFQSNSSMVREATLQQYEMLDSQNTEANVGSNSYTTLKSTTELPLDDNDSRKCLHAPNLQVRLIPQEECRSPYVIINNDGRLGNNLCQYMSLYFLRHFFGVRVSIDKKMHATLSPVLRSITIPVNETRCFTNDTKSIRYIDLYKMLCKATQVAKAQDPQGMVKASLLKRSYYVSDYPCPRELFLGHRDLVRHVLAFREDLLQRARDNMDRILRQYMNQTLLQDKKVTLITVHVRRTDYTKYLLSHYNLKQLDEVYFQRAFDFYRKKVVNPVFVVMSDDRKWCRKFLKAKDVMVTDDQKDAAVDLAMLTLGSHAVSSYGTFSFIGATLGPGNFTHPINDNKKYEVNMCSDFPVVHYINRDRN